MLASTSTLDPMTSILGGTIPLTLTENGHVWTADSNGLYHTTTDLAAEWKGYYQTMLAGKGGSLNDIQRLEGNAEAVFENTALSQLSTAQLVVDREDVQRQYDAMAAAMQSAGISMTGALTQQTYLQLENTLQSSPNLEELALQGHGLNNSGYVKYAGFTNDFQNNVDNTTLFIGGGLNNNKNALADFFDDNVLSHVPFGVVDHNGTLTQLDQNGDRENTLTHALVALDDSMVNRTYVAADFSATKSSANDHYVSPETAILAAIAAQPAPSGDIVTLFGQDISNTISTTAHVWVAGSDGLFHTNTDLAAEWHGYYVDLVTTGGHDLTPEQRLEANAEAVFENTGLAKLSTAQQQVDREDAQRQFDAEFAAMTIAKLDPTQPLTATTYLALGHALQGNASLEELAIQGHGLNDPSSARYNGYTNDFQHNVDNTTLFVGGGHNNNKPAIPDFFDDNVLSHLPFTVVIHNGALVQLNQNGNREDGLNTALQEIDNTIWKKIYDAGDFKS